MFKYLRKTIFFSSYLLESSDFQLIGHGKYISREKSKASVLALGHPEVSQNITPSLPLDLKFPYSDSILRTCSGYACSRTLRYFSAHYSSAFQSQDQDRTGKCRAEVSQDPHAHHCHVRPLGLSLVLAVGQTDLHFQNPGSNKS